MGWLRSGRGPRGYQPAWGGRAAAGDPADIDPASVHAERVACAHARCGERREAYLPHLGGDALLERGASRVDAGARDLAAALDRQVDLHGAEPAAAAQLLAHAAEQRVEPAVHHTFDVARTQLGLAT